MRPKKKDRPIQEIQKTQFDQIQADHELFLQAFEKPTQIYRYLRSRNMVSPLFLQRTLYYMSDRCLRKANTRKNFSVNSILGKIEAKHKKDQLKNRQYKPEYMNLTFLGFFDKESSDIYKAEVELYLMKLCHKKRKDVSSPLMEVNIGKVTVPCNPENPTPSKAQSIAVSSEYFNHNNGHSVKSYVLLIRVQCWKKTDTQTAMCNGDLYSEEEPPAKRRRKNHSLSTEDSSVQKENCLTPSHVTYGGELVIYDRYRRCLLTEGDYEVALKDLTLDTSRPKKQASWETVMDGKAVGPFETFNKCATLKFCLCWNSLPLNKILGSVEPVCTKDSATKQHPEDVDQLASIVEETRKIPEVSPSKRKRIFYQFLYNNNTRQQTEARDDLHCPWCSLKCLKLFSLLRHLRTCHARFNFIYMEHPKGARIDVSINDHFDGSYVGNPQDLHSHLGYAFSRTGPVRRTPVTHIIVYRPKQMRNDLSEFMQPETESQSNRELVQGHNRLYFRTATCIPVRPCEIDVDSEDENDPIWLRQKTINMIDEFTDVNEGEKEVMKMWNLHVMRNNYIGDCQVPRACSTFIQEYGHSIIEKNLCRNFSLHIANLFDFGLIKPEVGDHTMQQLYSLRDSLKGKGQSYCMCSSGAAHKEQSKTSSRTSTGLT